jgi:predicted nuclease with RNAse H fold
MVESVIAGADFSGSRETPNQTWLAVGKLDSMGVEIVDLRQTGSHRLAAELAGISGLKAVGLDFPFSLPAEFLRFCAEKQGLTPFQSWQELVEHLVFVAFDDFLALVKEFGREPKRLTDMEFRAIAKSPLHRGHPSMVQMTYHGMRLLSGLDPDRFSVLPFQDLRPGACAVLEVFPRATLVALRLPDSGYKSQEKKDRERVGTLRKQILEGLVQLREKGGSAYRDYPRLTINKSLQHQALVSADALDAVVACYTIAVWSVLPGAFADPLSLDNENVLLEGWAFAPEVAGQAKP